MADRVVIGGSTHDTDPDRRSMFNGFMSAFKTSIANIEDYPIACSRQYIAMMWQRVKRWTISTDLEIHAGVESVDLSGVITSAETNATRERDFATGFNITTGTSTNGSTGPGYPAANSTFWNVSFGISGFGGYGPDVYDDGTDLHLQSGFVGSLGAIDTPGPGADDIVLLIESNSSYLSVVTGSIDAQIIIPGFTTFSYPIYYDASAISGGAGYTFSKFIVTADEWWPYASKDGDPIYDTATGLLLTGMSPTD